MPRHFLPLFFILFHPMAQGGPKVSPEDDKLSAFFKEYLVAEFKQRPLEATRLGDHRFDHLLDDVSPKARAAWTERARKVLAELPRRIDYKKLTRGGQVDFEIWRHHLQRSLWLAENTRPFADDPRIYNEYLTESLYLVLTQSTLSKADNVRNCAARMAHIPRIVAAAKESLKNPPKVVVDTAVKQNRGAIAFFDNGIFELAGETPQLSALREGAKKVVPVLKEYQQWLERELLPRASGDWRLGKDKFAKKLELELDTGLSAADVLREAEAEMDHVLAEMYVVARQLWSSLFPGKAMPSDDAEDRKSVV